jgi:hypothetical protein
LFPRLARFLVLLAAVQILGGHWAVLQTVAWAQMIVDYAQQDSLTIAVTKTFDGAHPCSLCETVSEGRQQEKKQEGVSTIVKLDAVLAPAVELPPRTEAPVRFFDLLISDCDHSVAPLTPPPRRA